MSLDFNIRTVYATNDMSGVNGHGDAVWIGCGDDGVYSVNVTSLVDRRGFALISRRELHRIRDALDRELGPKPLSNQGSEE